MRYFVWNTIILFAFIFSQNTVAQQNSPRKELTKEQILSDMPAVEQPIPVPIGWEDKDHYLVSKGTGMDRKTYSVHIKTQAETLYTPKTPQLSVSVKEKNLFFRNNDEEKQLTFTAEEEKNPTLSPDGKWVAFTRNNDLYAVSVEEGNEIRFTHDGSNLILNGWASWVYYEEILGRASRYRAFWWSPDSKRLAFFRSDDSEVPMFPIYNSEGIHGFLEETRYPKAGDPNPKVRIGVVGVDGGSVTWADFNENEDQYFGHPYWKPDGSGLLVQWMNRDQDNLKMYDINLTDGSKKAIYEEKQTTWIDWIDALTWMKEGFLMIRDYEGWEHIYYHNNDGSVKKKLTDGTPWQTRIVKVDEKEQTVYYTTAGEIATRQDFYSVRLDGSRFKRLTFGAYNHTVQLSPDNKYFLTSYSNAATPTRLAVVEVKNGKRKELADSKGEAFDHYNLAIPEVIWLKTTDGYDLPATVTWPLNLDPNKKYPVIINIYGGPNSPSVNDAWRPRGVDSQWWAKEGVIQISFDHRGSGKCGKEGLNFMHRNLGKWEMEDYTAWVKFLRGKPFVDPDKIGITGGSYGGYMTAFALTYGSEYFKYGISLYPVTDWILYDSHYTERYMDEPKNNPEGYRFNSVMTHAEKYQGGAGSMLRILHGTMDDNVHMQNSIQLVDKLQNLNKEFEFMLYPGERHGWRGQKAVHLRNEAYRFWYRYLLEKDIPEGLLR